MHDTFCILSQIQNETMVQNRKGSTTILLPTLPSLTLAALFSMSTQLPPLKEKLQECRDPFTFHTEDASKKFRSSNLLLISCNT